MTHNKLMFLFISGLLSACASNNRSNYVTSIGTEDLTQKKPVNVIIYQERNLEARENKEVFNRAANEISSTLKQLSDKNRIRLNNTAFYSGDWFDVADLHFKDEDYNWTLKLWDSNLPKLGFQNFSTDIDSSVGVHFRYCKERTIQFANLSETQFSENPTYWKNQFYPAAIDSLYFLMKGNNELTPIQIKTYDGSLVNGTKLSENERYVFVLNGETEIYIVPKFKIKP